MTSLEEMKSQRLEKDGGKMLLLDRMIQITFTQKYRQNVPDLQQLKTQGLQDKNVGFYPVVQVQGQEVVVQAE
jgi:hypothetical protein